MRPATADLYSAERIVPTLQSRGYWVAGGRKRAQWFGAASGNETIEADQAKSAWNASTVTWNTAPAAGTVGANEVYVDDNDTADISASGTWATQSDSNAAHGE